MNFGPIKLFCPICAQTIVYAAICTNGIMHHREFGVVCSLGCWDAAEMKYARMILGKGDPV